MDVKRQQGGTDQGDLFDEALKAALRHGVSGEGGTEPATAEEPQALTVRNVSTTLRQPGSEFTLVFLASPSAG